MSNIIKELEQVENIIKKYNVTNSFIKTKTLIDNKEPIFNICLLNSRQEFLLSIHEAICLRDYLYTLGLE